MTETTLREYYLSGRGKVSDRWQIYLDVYERLLAEYRERALALLEIGIQNGGSLEIWARYFPNAVKLVGCDIDPACAELCYSDPRIAVVVGDAGSAAREREILLVHGDYDIVIDDGSHASGDIVRAFARYFPHLRDGGLYIVEDLHCSYWSEYQGGLFEPLSSIAFVKRLADIVNYQHWGLPLSPKAVLEPFFSHYGASIADEVLTRIHSVEIYNSICAIRAQSASCNSLGNRVVSGLEEQVVSGHLALRGTALIARDQTGYPRHEDPILTERELKRTLGELSGTLSERQAQLAERETQLAERDAQLAERDIQLAERDARLASIRGSLSWRMTEPLRRLALRLRGLGRGERSGEPKSGEPKSGEIT